MCYHRYADLFEIKCRNADRERNGRLPGDPQPLWIKLLIGFGLFAILCLVIWFPLLLLVCSHPLLLQQYLDNLIHTIFDVTWHRLQIHQAT